MGDAIVVQGIGKQFRRYHADRPTTLQEAILRGLRRMRPAEQFWALQEVSFTVARGTMVGIIGHNGAGKSTLLRLLGGVGRPDRGSLHVHGRIGALLDLGTGFHPDLTARENIFINGVICGLTRQEVKQAFDSIVAFAELEAFIDNPLRTYSSGMQMRLGFAIAAHIDPEILLIDEVLAVGDMAFQHKCLQRIEQFKAEGCTIVLVSHDARLVGQLCDEALWLRQGRIVAHGRAAGVVEQYAAEMATETRQRTPAPQKAISPATNSALSLNQNRFGSQEMQIVAVRLLDEAGLPVTQLDDGESLHIEIEYLAPQPIESPIFGITISRKDGFICYDTSTEADKIVLPTVQGRGQVSLHLKRLDLIGGAYYVDVGIYKPDWVYAYDYHWHVYLLLICPSPGEKGVLRPPHFWRIE